MFRRPTTLTALAVVAALAASLPSGAAPKAPKSIQLEDDYGFQGEEGGYVPDRDFRPGTVLPTAAQKKLAAGLGATAARWNSLGTPKVLAKHGGYLSGPRKGKATEVARAWLREHAALFGLHPAALNESRLELIGDSPFYEAPDLRRIKDGKKPLNENVAHTLLFRQVFDGVTAGRDGLLRVALSKDNRVVWVSSSVSQDLDVTNTRKLSAFEAYAVAARDVDRAVDVAKLRLVDETDKAGFTTFTIEGGTRDLQRARLRAVPTPAKGVRLAWETVVLQAHPTATEHPAAFVHFVDAETGELLHRANAMDHAGHGQVLPQATGDPTWKVFESSPAFPLPNVQTSDDRVIWCWVMASGCDRLTGHDRAGLRELATPEPYDVTFTEQGQPVTTFQTRGNNADTTTSFASHLTPDSPYHAASATRTYDFPFTDQWHTSGCFISRNYGTPERNDVDAAITNLFVMHNRMHDWGYFLGWTESNWNMQQYNFGEDTETSAQAKDGDPEMGQAQAGGLAGSIAFLGRDNANQITLQDGVPGVTNQYLWHPLQAGFYAACTDGAYDMSIVAHEVGHAIQNRMTDGPDNGLSGHQATAMGESWSDLSAIEYLNGYGFTGVADAHPYAVAPYATGSKTRGIRNYNMSDSPLNYSDLDYDGNGTTSPHADGEIWSATNFDIRQAFVAKYDDTHPYADKTLQYDCADGHKAAADCPGNRRWVQIMHDAFLLQPGEATMVDARDAQLAADMTRFDGANQKELWAAYARRGLGETAEAVSVDDHDPTPSWSSPVHTDEAKVGFKAVAVDGGGIPASLEVHVGRYEARTVPAAVSTEGKPSAAIDMAPATYEFIARADGYGAYRFTKTFTPGQIVTVDVPMRRNHASAAHGAEADGDGGNFGAVIDDTEGSNWAFVGETDTELVEGRQFTVALAGGRQKVADVQISTANRPGLCDSGASTETVNCTDDDDTPYDPNSQSRFAALRSFEILTCDTTAGSECAAAEDFTLLYTSSDDAFAAERPRPLAPNLQLKSFDVPDTFATHVRLRVLTNQCTGNPAYTAAENPVSDPGSNPDCVEGFTAAALTGASATNDPTIRNTQRHRVRVAELQVFSQAAPNAAAAPVTPPVVNPGPVTPPAPQPKPDPLPATGNPLPMLAALVLLTAGATIAYGRRRIA